MLAKQVKAIKGRGKKQAVAKGCYISDSGILFKGQKTNKRRKVIIEAFLSSRSDVDPKRFKFKL